MICRFRFNIFYAEYLRQMFCVQSYLSESPIQMSELKVEDNTKLVIADFGQSICAFIAACEIA